MTVSSLFGIAGSALTAQSERMNVAASNMANEDSVSGPDGHPYRAREVTFSTTGNGGVEVSKVSENQSPFQKMYSPGSPMANAQGYVSMPNVNPTAEMVDMISAARSYQANVNVLETGKALALRTLTLDE